MERRRYKMNKLLILAIALVVVFASFPNSYARTRYRTFEVFEIQSDGIVLMDSEGGKFLVEKDSSKIKGGLKVGDSVRYEPRKNRLKKNPWQPAKITKVTNRSLTLQLNNGDPVDVGMKSKFQGKFEQGDQVSYNASKDQIKKGTLPEQEEK
jgi:hypothetical protein